MDTFRLCLVLFLISGISAQQCDSSYPTAFMCQSSVVQGHTVTLDASMAINIPTRKCSCSVQANVSGMIVQFDSYPQSSKCYTEMELRFQEKSIKFKCGAPLVAESSSGTSATVIYSLDSGAIDPDSTYCLTFNSSSTDTNIVLTCEEPDPSDTVPLNTTSNSSTTSTTTSSTSSSTQSTSTAVLSITSSLTTPTNSSSSSFSSSSSTKSAATTRITSAPTSLNATTISPTLPTTTSSQGSISTADLTTTIGQTTPLFISSDSPTSGTPNSNTTLTESTPVTSENVTHQTSSLSTELNSTTQSVATMKHVNITSTPSPNNITTNEMSITTFVPNNETHTNANNATTAVPNNVTDSTDTPVNATTVIPNTNVTSSTVVPNNVTSSVLQNNVSSVMPISTTDNNTTSNSPVITTISPNNATTTLNNSTHDNVTIISTISTVSTTNLADNSTANNVTLLTTVLPDNTTSIADNVTIITTISSDNTTSIVDNSTADNVTDVVTTRSPTKTTSNGFLEIPNDYEESTKPNSNLVIILPLVSILLLALIVGGTVIICKRSKRAARLQKERSKDIAKRPKPEKKQENPFLISNYHQIKENGKDGDGKGDGKDDKKQVTNNKDDKYHERESKDNIKEKRTGKLKDTKSFENNNNNTGELRYKMNSKKAPEVYEPNDYEKDVLDNLELTSIVIEPDPEDSNRYFRKTDPGDWYRVIMKGKKPKPEDELGKTTDSKSGKKSHDRKKRSSKSGSDSKSDESSRDKSADSDQVKAKGRTKHRDSLNETSKSKTSLDSWDELDSHDASVPVQSAPTPQPRLVVSKPISEPHVVESTNPPATRVIMSQSKSAPPSNTGAQQGGQKLVQMRAGSSGTGSASVGAAQATRTVSPANIRQTGIKTSPIKRPDIVPPLKL